MVYEMVNKKTWVRKIGGIRAKHLSYQRKCRGFRPNGGLAGFVKVRLHAQ